MKKKKVKVSYNPKLMYFFIAFLLAALADFVFTIINLNTIGWQFEGNPVAKGVMTAALTKVIVIWLGWHLWKKYDGSLLPTKFFITGFFLLTILLQFFGAWTHINIMMEYHGAELIPIGDDTLKVVKPDGEVLQFSPDPNAVKLYALIILFGAWIPIIFGYFNTWLILWLDKEPKKASA